MARRAPHSRSLVQLVSALVAAALALALSVDQSSAQRIHQPAAVTPDRQANPEPTRGGDRVAPRPVITRREAASGGRASGRTRGEGDEGLGRDPFRSMGGNSPFCRRSGLGPRERANCRTSGALSHPQRIDHYGFDTRIDTGLDNITGNFAAALQSVAGLLWLGLLYTVKGVALALEWAFSLDLLSDAMAAVKQALLRLHRDVFGQAWFIAAIAAVGVWGIWRGFVQRKTIQTISGLGATVACMVVALVIIHSPGATVGQAGRLANDASLGIVSGATTGSVSKPARGFGGAMTRVFDQSVLRPWCALQFSDVAFCLANPRKVIPAHELPGDLAIKRAWATSSSVAEMWLRFEPNGKDDNDQREQLYEEWKDNDGERLQAVVRIQKEPATATRLALLALITIGVAGMICLFGWIALRLLGYGVLALVLVLLAPIALLMPALGDTGRATFMQWAKRLLGALVAKAIYAVFLALVLVASAALSELDELGFIAQWLLLCVVYWSLFIKRGEILQLASAGAPQERHGSLMQRLYYGHQGMRAATAAKDSALGKARAGGAKAALPAVAGIGAARRRSTNTAAATQSAADEQARARARETLGERHAAAQGVVDRDERAGQSLGRLDHLLARHDERVETAKANGADLPEPTEAHAALLRRRETLHAQRPSRYELTAAREQLRHADVNRARTGSAISPADERAQIAQRRQELATLPADADPHLRAAGIDPDRYRAAPAAERRTLQAHVDRHLERERTQLGVLPDAPPDGVRPPPGEQSSPTGRQVRAARATIDPDQLRAARKATNDANRAARRADRARAKVAPPKVRS